MQLITTINKKIEDGFLPVNALLSKFQFNEKPQSYLTDPRYLPLYYYLGQESSCKNLLEIGFGSGLVSGCFLLGSKTVEKFLAFQPVVNDEYYSLRIGKHNIANCYRQKSCIHFGDFAEASFIENLTSTKWDVAIVNVNSAYDQYLFYLRSIWPNISDNGLLILDQINSHKSAEQSCLDFAKVNHREVFRFKSKYSAALIVK